MSSKERTFASEKGAVFVQVGISIFVMMAFNVFVLDYGMMWVGRRQAQNAADAGALAGATARAYDDFDVFTVINRHRGAERGAGRRAEPRMAAGAALPRCYSTVPRGSPGKCAHVNVYRNGQNGSTPLPTLFGPIFGINTRASARQRRRSWRTAMPRTASVPSRFPDNWIELSPPLTPTSTVHALQRAGRRGCWSTRDTYVAPSATQVGPTRCTRRTSANGDHLARHGATPSLRPSRTGSSLELDLRRRSLPVSTRT